MAAFLDQRREEALYAFRILRYLCTSGIRYCKENADLLARLQGARRLSNILRPEVQASKEPVQAAGKAISLHAVNAEPLSGSTMHLQAFLLTTGYCVSYLV